MSARPSGCEARVEGDELACARCRLRWDRQDPEPPPNCRRRAADQAALALHGGPAAEVRTPALVPVELPPELADRMARAYDARQMGFLDEESAVTTSRAAMRAAWRVFLDERAV